MRNNESKGFQQSIFFQNEKADEEMFRNLVLSYFKNKCEKYKIQDITKNREIDEDNYVDEKWCLKHFKGCCCKCGLNFIWIPEMAR